MWEYKNIASAIIVILTLLASVGDFAHKLLGDLEAVRTHLRANDSRLDQIDAPPPNPAVL